MAGLDQFRLGFKNFKKFAECPSIDVSGVTFLVGKNNSGKSTYINGLLLMRDNFKKIFIECEDVCHLKFTIDNNDAMIFSFGDALCRNAETNDIIFSYNGTEICVYSDKKEDKEVPIKYLKSFEDTRTWFFDFVNQKVTCTINLIKEKESLLDELGEKEEELKDLDKTKNDILNLIEVGEGYCKKDDCEIMNGMCSNAHSHSKMNHNEERYEDYWRNLNKEEIPEAIESLKRGKKYYEKEIIETTDECDKKKLIIDFLDSLIESKQTPEMTITVPFPVSPTPGNVKEELKNQIWKYAHANEFGFDNILQPNEIELVKKRWIGYVNRGFVDPDRPIAIVHYIPAYLVPKQREFNVEDANDLTAQALHKYHIAYKDFKNSKEEEVRADCMHRFVQFWLNQFEIGTDFRIESIDGHTYSCQVLNMTNEWIHLAELGRGPAHLTMMLIRIAAIFPKHGFLYNTIWGRDMSVPWGADNSLIALEEPEQNLHPALQSKLADLFCSLSVIHGHPCLIETHSEYLIRRAQVIVKNKEYIGPGVEDHSMFIEEDNELIEYYTWGIKDDHFLDNISRELKKNPFHVYYFPHEVSSEGKDEPELPYEMVIREDGFFERSFGPGFFDEAGKWHLQLLNYSCN